MAEILYKEEAYTILGACFEVFNEMGPGFLEGVYQECLGIEFGLRSVPSQPKCKLVLTYKNRTLEQYYCPDFLCHEKIILEIKAVSHLTDEFRAQTHNYLKATGLRLALLINFGSKDKLEYERIIR